MSSAARLHRVEQDRVLFSASAQAAVLGSVLLNNQLIDAIELMVDDFSGAPDRLIYSTILEQWEDRSPLDIATTAENLRVRGLLEQVGGVEYVCSLVDGAVPDPGLVQVHCRSIRRFARLRRLSVLGERLSRDAWEPGADPERLAQELIRSLPADYGTPATQSDGLICLADVEPVRVDWLWKNRIPRGTVTMIDGDPGLGKSTMALDIVARVTIGAAMPFEELPGGPPTGVIVLSAEDLLAQTIRPRLDAAGADINKVFSFDPDSKTAPLTFPNDVARLEQMIHHRLVSLIVADPLVAYLGEDINSHRDQDVRRALAPLQRMAERTNTAVMGIRHLNKTPGANALYRGAGSIAIIGAARAGFLVASDPDDPETRVLAPTKANLAPPVPSLKFQVIDPDGSNVPKIAWRGTSERSASELVAQSTSEEDKSAVEDAVDFLQEILWNEAKTTKEVQLEAKRRGLSWRTIKRAKPKAGVRSRPPKSFQGEWLLELQSGPKPPTLDQ